MMQFEEFGPLHPGHRRISWSYDCKELVIQLPSTFIALLADNKPISGTDKSIVSEFRASISALIEENERLQAATIEELKLIHLKLHKQTTEHHRLEKQQAACDVILSPFRRVVDDVVHQIIQHAIPTSREELPDVPRQSSLAGRMPMALARVSRQFRRTTHSVSRLWKDMLVVWNKDPRQPTYLEYIKLSSELSKNLPLSIHLAEQVEEYNTRASSSYTFDPSPVLHWMFSDWSKLANLACLTLTSPNYQSFLSTFRHLVSKEREPSLSNLKALVLCTSGGTSTDEEELECEGRSLNLLLQDFSSLRHLRFDIPIGDTFIPVEPPSTPFSAWGELTTLCIENICLNSTLFARFLMACPNLQAASFSLNEFYESNYSITSTIVHRNLKELVITYWTAGSFPIFVDRRFPVLTTLKIQYYNTEFDKTAEFSDEARVAEVFPALQHLSLYNTQEIENKLDSVFPFIQRLPTLTHLSISLSPMDVAVLSTILQPPQDETSQYNIPNLQHIDLIFETSGRNKYGVMKMKELKQTIIDIRNSRNSQNSKASRPRIGPENTMQSPLSVTVRFTWTKRCFSKVMTQYFLELRKEFNEEGVDIEVQLEEERVEQDDDLYFENQLMHYFDGCYI